VIFFFVGDLGVEALRVADGEFSPALGQRDQRVGLPQLERDRLLSSVLAGLEAIARREMRARAWWR
jgi:hypothetical protein